MSSPRTYKISANPRQLAPTNFNDITVIINIFVITLVSCICVLTHAKILKICVMVNRRLTLVSNPCSFVGQLQPFCEDPADRGPCNKLELRYRFNEDSEYCETFLYGGCAGNKNNFKTVGECVKACVDGKGVFADLCSIY